MCAAAWFVVEQCLCVCVCVWVGELCDRTIAQQTSGTHVVDHTRTHTHTHTAHSTQHALNQINRISHLMYLQNTREQSL